MLESARILLEIFVAWLENCSKYLLLGLAWLGFYLKLNCSKMLGSVFKFPARRALVFSYLEKIKIVLKIYYTNTSYLSYYHEPFGNIYILE